MIKIRGKALPDWASNIVAVVVILSLVYLVIELLIRNLEGVLASWGQYSANLDKIIGEITAFINDPKYAEYLQNWLSGIDVAGMATSLVNSLSSVAANLVLVIVYVIFFMLEDATHRSKIEKLFPSDSRAYDKFFSSITNISDSIRSYIGYITLFSFITAVLSYGILLLMDVDYAFLWAFLIFILSYIPYVGPLIASILPAIFAALVSGNVWKFVYVFAAMEGVQVVLANSLEPKLMGKGANLSPVAVLIFLAFWGMLWGVVGMFLAVPIMSVVVIVCSQIPSARFFAILISEKGEIPPLEK